MIVLDSTATLKLTVTGNADVLVCGVRKTASACTPFLQQTAATAGASPNTIRTAPGASEQDEIDFVMVTDTSGAANALALSVVGAITTIFPTVTVAANEGAQYTHGSGLFAGIGTAFADGETPSGGITGTNGTDGNAAFTLTYTPDPTGSLMLVKNDIGTGLVMIAGIHFNLSTKTVTYTSGNIPYSPQTHRAWYRHRGV